METGYIGSYTIAESEGLQKKWQPILEHASFAPIKDHRRRDVTAKLLENQQRYVTEAAPVNNFGGGNIKVQDPVLIKMVRRSAPALIAHDICGVQPMQQSTGLVFALKSTYRSQTGPEALFTEANTEFSGQSTEYHNSPFTENVASYANDFANVNTGGNTVSIDYGTHMTTAGGELLGGDSANNFNEMGISISKTTVTAGTRALKAEYTHELEQDLKAAHGLSASDVLTNILTQEITAEINREICRTIYFGAKIGAQTGTTSAGTFDLANDSDGRWSQERWQGLRFQLSREANQIYMDTRRGRGNLCIMSADAAAALEIAGIMTPAYNDNLDADPSSSTFVGTLGNGMKIYIDPYYVRSATNKEFAVIGYKGALETDAGLFYCPYIPLQMYTTIGENTFEPKIAFKTRYGIAVNPFVNSAGTVTEAANSYYRRIQILNIL